ncbi:MULTISPECIES: sulfite exporter TauE/SafE family protein [unclassified Halomonas]|uniref:sulfite exporter TauE/SafE family protein n=1 Tax=unclassified Halomonas TaxID=2609666 RepID=UPI0021E39FA5|nr:MULTISPECIES: sulfite exporter TauE/SafE family protein [unclassified Halomonas]UYF99607.1 sulfite exporter TauE/SafE family protein [Halomonas sp. GD1P12]WNL39289.1 sulfite exporter TauE/SafE family protein [Halomonas sp. PAMB 3232]
MLPDFSLLAWLLIIFSVYLTGVSKGGFAGGFGTLSVPLMALVISPTQAAGLLLPLLLVMDVFAVKAWWGKHDMAEVWRFLPGLFIGVAVGTLLFGSLSDQGVRLVLGGLSLVFAVYMLFKPVAKKPISTRWALPAASVCGFTSFIAHAGAPPLNVYLLPRKLAKETFIATCAVAFAIVNAIKLGPYVWLGEVNLTSAWASLLLVPVAWIGVRSGLWLQSRVNDVLFYRLVIIAMLLVGANLIGQALGAF